MPAGRPPGTVAREVVLGVADLDVHVQPIVDLQRGVAVGYEALSRFACGTPPDLVFDAAARAGIGARLQAIALRRAMRLRPLLPPNTFLSVNIDPNDLTDPVLLEVLHEAAPLHGLVLEVTERDAMDLLAVAEVLGELRQGGATIAIDDVGAGYAGLQALIRLRPQLVKVDRALVAGLHDDPVKHSVLQMLGELAGRLDAWVLVEGTEKIDEVEAALALGVPLGQGFLFGRPDPGFHPVAAALTRQLQGMARTRSRTAGGTVAALVAPVAIVDHVLRAPAGTAVLVDEARRPVALLEDGLTADGEPIVVQAGEQLTHLGARLAAAHGFHRHVVVVGTDGAVLGTVDVRQVLGALARSRAEASDPS